MQYHGMVGVLLKFHSGTLADHLPQQFAQAVNDVHQQNVVLALQRMRVLHRLAAALNPSGINWVAFKGPVLSQLLYADFATRGVGDLDLLVDACDLDQAARALEQAGFKQVLDIPPAPNPLRSQFLETAHQLPFSSPEGILIELHWRTESLSAMCLPPLKDLTSSLTSCQLGPTSVKTFARELYVPYVAIHAARSLCMRWKWGYDLLELLEPGRDSGVTSPPAYLARAEKSVVVTRGLMRHLLRLEEIGPRTFSDPLRYALRLHRAALRRRGLEGIGRESMRTEFRHRSMKHLYLVLLQEGWAAKLACLRVIFFGFSPIAAPTTALWVARMPWLAPFVRLFRRLRLPRARIA